MYEDIYIHIFICLYKNTIGEERKISLYNENKAFFLFEKNEKVERMKRLGNRWGKIVFFPIDWRNGEYELKKKMH